MDKMRIVGGNRLSGTIEVGGAKNAALPILFSTLLTEGSCKLTRVPRLQDIETTVQLLSQMGVQVVSPLKNGAIELCASKITSLEAPYDLVRKMRASFVVMGPLLARFGEVKVSLPGGCAIGARPINYHLEGFARLGAEIDLSGGYVVARAKKLVGNRVTFPFPSVGATENLMMAAVLAQGETVLENCAKEPEIVDLALMLKAMGAQMTGEGTETIHIQGVKSLHGCEYRVMGDRIEAGTFLAAGLITGGSVQVNGIDPVTLEAVLGKFESVGAQIERGAEFIKASAQGRLKGTEITTLPFPGFPTDMQAQFMALMAVSDGASLFTETIFENRYMHVPELMRLGADITVRGNTAMVRGVAQLKGAPLMATDLRASASLILGALVAEGETEVNRIYHLDRGYEGMENKLKKLGAVIERVK